MSIKLQRFRDGQPVAWTYHRNTSRWAHNATTAKGEVAPQPPLEFPAKPAVELPSAHVPALNLAELLSQRFSCRRFSDKPVSLIALSDLLYTAYGVLGNSHFGRLEFLERPVPSAGGLYPLELFILANDIDSISPGVYHYATITHCLEQLRDVKLPLRLREYLFMGQRTLAQAPLIVVFAAVAHRCMSKYGDRGYRYILLEAGHSAQNLNLAATAIGLGSCNIGGFFDQELGDLLFIDREVAIPLYAVAIGHPIAGSRESLRGIDD